MNRCCGVSVSLNLLIKILKNVSLYSKNGQKGRHLLQFWFEVHLCLSLLFLITGFYFFPEVCVLLFVWYFQRFVDFLTLILMVHTLLFFKQQETCQVILPPGVALWLTLHSLCFPSTQSPRQDLWNLELYWAGFCFYSGTVKPTVSCCLITTFNFLLTQKSICTRQEHWCVFEQCICSCSKESVL